MEYEVGAEGDLLVGQMITAVVAGKNVVVFRQQDGALSALEDRCSHADVRLSGGEFADGVIRCHAHGAKFDTKTGKQLCMPAVSPVAAYAVVVRDGKIFVSI